VSNNHCSICIPVLHEYAIAAVHKFLSSFSVTSVSFLMLWLSLLSFVLILREAETLAMFSLKHFKVESQLFKDLKTGLNVEKLFLLSNYLKLVS
jgi:hypothetical protein